MVSLYGGVSSIFLLTLLFPWSEMAKSQYPLSNSLTCSMFFNMYLHITMFHSSTCSRVNIPVPQSISLTIHVWYIYLHLPYFTIRNNPNVCKYTPVPWMVWVWDLFAFTWRNPEGRVDGTQPGTLTGASVRGTDKLGPLKTAATKPWARKGRGG